MTAHELKRMLISVLYPNRCPFCDKEIEWDKYFCDSCYTKLNFIDTAKTDTDVGEIIAVCAYDDAAKTIVYPMKDDNNGYAMWAAARLICDRLEAAGESFDVVTSIPMLKADYNKRGYNQTLLMAKEISEIMGIPLSKGIAKIKETKSQKGLRGKARRTNLIGAFKVSKPQDFSGKRVLLIDDICTTGSTLSEVRKVIMSAGAESVTCAVFAKTVKNG